MALVQQALAAPGELTLIAVGPLTNVALAMRLDPQFAASLKQLVIMGGVFLGRTNTAGMPGEFNIWSDPEAAQIVLDSGIQATWVGLDVTRRVTLSRGEASAMADSERSVRVLRRPVQRGLDRSPRWQRRRAGVLRPARSARRRRHEPAESADLEPAYLEVETGDRFRGAILTDLGSRSQHLDSQDNGMAIGHFPNALVCCRRGCGRLHGPLPGI